MNKLVEKNRLEEKLTRETINLRVVIVSAMASLSSLPIWYAYARIIEPWSIFVRALAETIAIAGFVGITYEILVRRRFEKEMAFTLIKTISADVMLLKKEFKDIIEDFIKNCLHAKLCNKEKADALYQNLVLPNIDENTFRTKFDYKIFLRDITGSNSLSDLDVDKNNYFEMEELLEYKKSLNLKEINELVIGICFDDEQLKHYQDKNCIYRIILRIKGSDKEKVLDKVISDRNSINKIFKIEKLKVANQELNEINISNYETDKGIKITCKGDKKIENGEVPIYIKVKTIRDRNINYYTAYIFDPTYAPIIMLCYPSKDIKEVSPVIYFTSESKGRGIDPKRGTDYICINASDEWVFPNSGVVFVWDKK